MASAPDPAALARLGAVLDPRIGMAVARTG
jgi:hypothetical protein